MNLKPIFLSSNIFKKAFLEQYSHSDLLFSEISITLIVAFLLSSLILVLYKHTYQSVSYQKYFAISIPLATLITTTVLIAVSTNIVLSFGMVGALSIVRFRTALKNPLDSIFMYWSIGVGITCGAGLLSLSVVSTLIIGIILYTFYHFELLDDPYVLIISTTNQNEIDNLINYVKKIDKKSKLRNQTLTSSLSDLTFELRVKENKFSEVAKMQSKFDVEQVILLTSAGDFITE